MQPLPPGGVPADQTVEGAAQIRVTPSGFDKITGLLDAVIDDALAGGFCIPKQSVIGIDVCDTNVGQCTPGCRVNATTDYIQLDDLDADTLGVEVQFDAQTNVHVDAGIFGSCTLNVTLNNGQFEADVDIGVDAATGELTIDLGGFRTDQLDGINISGCGVLGSILGALLDAVIFLFEDAVNDFLVGIVRPLIEGLLADLLPDPLGVEGTLDLGELIGFVSPDVGASLELRGVTGGFAQLGGEGLGLTLGMIVGINSDADPSTRTPELDSEPARCVPARPGPDYDGVLQPSPRGSYTLLPAEEFLGNPEPSGDVAIGLSETALDLAGHHAVASGALCLELGTEQIPQLNLGLIGLLVPSLAELAGDSGSDPLLLLTRPLEDIDFAIGDGTEQSPSLQVKASGLEIDFYGFVLERYVRAFTVRLGLDVGINLEYATSGDGTPTITPILVGLDADNIEVTARNTEFLRESPQQLEAILPSVLELVLPQLTSALGAIELPEFAGFRLDSLATGKVVTSEDDFLAITATLEPAASLSGLAAKYPAIAVALGDAEPAPPRATTRASLVHVNTPPPAIIRAGLMGLSKGQLPEVAIDVASHDDLGRPLEWSWSLDDGMWRPFTRQTPLVIRDRALVWQGHHTVSVRARVVGDYRTLDLEPVRIPVVIDSAPPRILVHRARLDGGELIVPATDLVTASAAIEFAYGRPDLDQPATGWSRAGLPEAQLGEFARDGLVAVYARDGLGNVGRATVDTSGLVESRPETGGCAATGGGSGGAAVLVGLCLLLVGLGRRRGALAALLCAVTGLAGCDCGSVPAEPMTCEANIECADACGEGEVGLCIDSACTCIEDVPPGRIGRFSEMALAPSGEVWVSAYNEEHGDLNVVARTEPGAVEDTAWEFVDGVPDGPVAFDNSDIRNGVLAAGEDVGKYTSLAVNARGEAMVAYFDYDSGALRFAVKTADSWKIHTVDDAEPSCGVAAGTEVVGQYSSVTVRDNGNPGIAYFVQIRDGEEVRTQVRFASAQTDLPSQAEDWICYVADQTVVTSDASDQDPYSIPLGTGLFIDSARAADGTPVVVYYDRVNGDLRLARFELMAGTFAPPVVLDGGDGNDVGWYPSLAIDEAGTVHVSYVGATHADLLYINTADNTPVVVDDGYRIAGMTDDGYPIPEFHLVGDDSSLVLADGRPAIVYQDATSHELVLAEQSGDGEWQRRTIAGDEAEFAGGYGFYASAAHDGRDIVISNWVVHPPDDRVWVEIFRVSPGVE